ncbi:MAG: nitrate reductase [Pseudomonadota bacterium]
MYEFVRGPLVWVAFIGFTGGALYKIVSMALLAKKEKVVFPTLSCKFGLRSVIRWIIPFSSRNMRMHPVMTIVSFAFHFCLVVTPLFVMGHAVLWQESWGVSWWSLPAWVADTMTLVVVFACLFFFLRRVAAPEVRNVTAFSDFSLLLLVVAPFLTGFLAHQQMLPYEQMLILHIVSGVVWLIAIPFTRLSHMLWFAISRSYMGSEFGAVRNARDW